MKDAYYFSHDSNARNDLKVVKLKSKLGMSGIGIFWCTIEMLRETENYELKLSDIESICYELRCSIEDFNELFECGLLQKCEDEGVFYSASLTVRMQKLNDIKQKRAIAGAKGGQTLSKTQAKVKQNEASKVKYSIVNEIKENNTIENKSEIFKKCFFLTSEFWGISEIKTPQSYFEIISKLTDIEKSNQLDYYFIQLTNYKQTIKEQRFKKTITNWLRDWNLQEYKEPIKSNESILKRKEGTDF